MAVPWVIIVVSLLLSSLLLLRCLMSAPDLGHLPLLVRQATAPCLLGARVIRIVCGSFDLSLTGRSRRRRFSPILSNRKWIQISLPWSHHSRLLWSHYSCLLRSHYGRLLRSYHRCLLWSYHGSFLRSYHSYLLLARIPQLLEGRTLWLLVVLELFRRWLSLLFLYLLLLCWLLLRWLLVLVVFVFVVENIYQA